MKEGRRVFQRSFPKKGNMFEDRMEGGGVTTTMSKMNKVKPVDFWKRTSINDSGGDMAPQKKNYLHFN